MRPTKNDEWGIIEKLLPAGWQDQARELKAFRRARYTRSPAELLRLLLFHAVNDSGLAETVSIARASGIANMSKVALFKRLRTSDDWLRWIASGLCNELRERVRVPNGLRLRVIDSTTIQQPASKGIDWRLHYTLDLLTLNCDWHELTDVRGGESFDRTPVQKGDVLLADRGFTSPAAIRRVVERGGHVLVRLRWNDPAIAIQGPRKEKHTALRMAQTLRVGEVGDWLAELRTKDDAIVSGRIVAIKLPAPIARKAERKAKKLAIRKQTKIDPRTIQASHYVILFTTLPASLLDSKGVADLYRFRWQIELAFKHHKQLLKLGRLPHKDCHAAQSFILAKLIVALLLETIYRNAVFFSPWGYALEDTQTSE